RRPPRTAPPTAARRRWPGRREGPPAPWKAVPPPRPSGPSAGERCSDDEQVRPRRDGGAEPILHAAAGVRRVGVREGAAEDSRGSVEAIHGAGLAAGPALEGRADEGVEAVGGEGNGGAVERGRGGHGTMQLERCRAPLRRI